MSFAFMCSWNHLRLIVDPTACIAKLPHVFISSRLEPPFQYKPVSTPLTFHYNMDSNSNLTCLPSENTIRKYIAEVSICTLPSGLFIDSLHRRRLVSESEAIVLRSLLQIPRMTECYYTADSEICARQRAHPINICGAMTVPQYAWYIILCGMIRNNDKISYQRTQMPRMGRPSRVKRLKLPQRRLKECAAYHTNVQRIH